MIGMRKSNPKIKVPIKDENLWNAELVGIDRKDSSKPYAPDNCLPCCSICNQMKMDLSYDDFKSNISAIYDYFVRDKN